MKLNLPSPIQTVTFENRAFYLKRDDLIHPDFSGNKARKFYYFLKRDFPQIKRIVSYGSAQSNAMYSLSVLAKMRGWDFDYYVSHLPPLLRDDPHGNYKAAIENGMRLHIGKPPESYGSETLFIAEGGAQVEAEEGIRLLAEEIVAWQKMQRIEKLSLFLPSGTGTTALYLQKSFCLLGSMNRVYTVACVKGSDDLRWQFSLLEADEALYPQVLEPLKRYRFGTPYRELYVLRQKLKMQTGVAFDLLYDPIGWQTLLAHIDSFDAPILYLHQGGLKGNESMARRYVGNGELGMRNRVW